MALLSIFDISASALTAQSQRLNVSASNMANAESVAVGRRTVPRETGHVSDRAAGAL